MCFQIGREIRARRLALPQLHIVIHTVFLHAVGAPCHQPTGREDSGTVDLRLTGTTDIFAAADPLTIH